jgi:hypothetical protein
VGFGIETPLLLVFSGVVATSVMRSLAQRHVSDASFSSSAPAEHEASKEEEEPSVTTGAHLEDRYEVGDVIGCGHFATVRRGVNRESGEAVAIKTIAKSRTDASTIRREIAIQRMVGSHENMVGLRDVFETESEWIIVMELDVPRSDVLCDPWLCEVVDRGRGIRNRSVVMGHVSLGSKRLVTKLIAGWRGSSCPRSISALVPRCVHVF